MKGEFYAGVENPVELRKNILETSKDVIHDLQRYESLKLIRGQKRAAMSKLKEKIAEINSLIAKLSSALPETGIEKERVSEYRQQPNLLPKQLKAAALKDKKKKPKTELEQLTDSLKDIEEKLKGLG